MGFGFRVHGLGLLEPHGGYLWDRGCAGVGVLGCGGGITRVSREMWDEEFQRAAVVSESCCGFGQLNVWIKEQNSRLKGFGSKEQNKGLDKGAEFEAKG